MFSEIPTPAETTPEITTQTGSNFATTSLSTTTTANSELQQEITTFHDVETPQLTITPMAANTSGIGTMDDTASIVNFLQRPVQLDYFKLDPTAPVGKDDVSEWTVLKPIVLKEPQRPIRSYNLPQDVLEKGGKLAKTQNHQFFKADIHIKLTLNVNPFVAGRFYLTYSPYENSIVKARQQRWASRAGVTAYPGVEFDVQLGNTVEMVIPFASYKEAYVLTSEPENFVVLNLYALTPILGNKDGKGPIEFTIFSWFENITINLPTNKLPPSLTTNAIPITASVVSQVDKKRLKFARAIEKLKFTDKSTYEAILRRLPVEFQIQAEAKAQLLNDKKGPIGEISGIVGQIGGWAENSGIPVVNEIGGTVKWISDIVGSIAGIFGWSRPNSMSAVVAYQNVPGKYYTHIKAEDQSVALALSQENELSKPVNIFPSNVDEMDLSYVCANPAVKAIYEWKMNGATGMKDFANQPIGLLPVGIGCFTALYDEVGSAVESLPSIVYPEWGDGAGKFDSGTTKFRLEFRNHFQKVVDNSVFKEADRKDFGDYHGAYFTGAGKDAKTSKLCSAYPATLVAKGTKNRVVLDTAPCEYVSQLFQYWRATICFKVCVVKTAFHTGRLEIFFEPGMYQHKDDVSVSPNLDAYRKTDTTNNYKYILDITNDSEVTIRVPYISEKLFLSTRGLNTGLNAAVAADVADSITGSLVIRPLTNLLAPETVSDSVQIVVWKWAEDVVLTAPINASNTDIHIYNAIGDDNGIDSGDNVQFTDIPGDTIRKMKYDGEESKPAEPDSDKCPNGFETEDGKCIPVRSVQLQINLANTSSGNVVTLFDSVDIERQNMLACENAAGERIVSLRPLLRCFRDWKHFKSEKYPGNGYIGKTIFLLDFQKETNSVDYLNYLSYMYRFFRGGVRYKVLTLNGVTRSYIHPGDTFNTRMAPSHATIAKVNPLHEISVPYYSQYRKLPISAADNLLNVTVINLNSDSTAAGFNKFNGAEVLRAGNDDLTYGWLMGTPQLMTGGGSIQWTSYVKTGDATTTDNQWKNCSPNQSCASGDEPQNPASYAGQAANPYAAPYTTISNKTKRSVEGYDTVDAELQMAPIDRPPSRDRELLEKAIAGYSSAAVSLNSIINRLQSMRLRLLRPLEIEHEPLDEVIVQNLEEEEVTPRPRPVLQRQNAVENLQQLIDEVEPGMVPEDDSPLEEDCLGPIRR